MAPLIDVVFLLLTFFVFSLVLLRRVSVMELDLPALATGQQAQDSPAVVVAIDRTGRLLVEGRPVGSAVVLDSPAEAGNPLSPQTIADLLQALRQADRPAENPADGPGLRPAEAPARQARRIRLEVDQRGPSGAMLGVLDALRSAGYQAIDVVGTPLPGSGPEPAPPPGEPATPPGS